ncbi:hypothetical protein JZ785_05860 [Alicyclobacillus curvatus]|nr:hypothetical protein JZ785_05860 [Alicyclobacillus curvatus]
MERRMETPFLHFLRLARRVIILVMIAWIILGVARMLRLESSRDPFAPPSPPFQAVSSSGGAKAASPSHAGWEKTVGMWIHQVRQMILYAPK